MRKYENSTIKTLFLWCLALCASLEFIIIQYFNFFEPKEHLGVDSSFEYLKTAVISKVGAFYPADVLSYTTCPREDKIFFLAAPLNRLLGNLWISYGISTLIITVLMIFV